ncbi:hypothetical protein N825_01635 [Skermanella stibiiresistens SB22]|uniref:Uncharacterized protein n=1 Tax=Skermanella stibiiresistens SB22 TaxID=1385369 RepID=W9HD43_9PROT|nr:hypothetical protein N825_01635 [Skermanella stibiiresistens SB22]
MVVLRVIGAVLLVAGLAALGWDLWRWSQIAGVEGGLHLTAAGELWYGLHPGSLNLTQAVVQRYLSPSLWDPALVTILLWPAALVLAVPGIVLLALGSIRRSGSHSGSRSRSHNHSRF